MPGKAVWLCGLALVVGGFAVTLARESAIQKKLANIEESQRQNDDRIAEIVRSERMLVTLYGDLNNRQVHIAEASSKETKQNGGADDKPVAAAAPETAAAQPLSPEVQERVDRANEMVSSALSSGQWTEQNRNDFRRLLHTMPPPTGSAIARRIIMAMNAHQLDFRAGGPPF